MTTYVALLRGINLGSHNKIGMGELRRLFADLGHTDVQSYLQSGNVIFRSAGDAENGESGLAEQVEQRLAKELGVTVTVLLRTGDELGQLVANNPFLGVQDDPLKLHVTFLAHPPEPDRANELDRPDQGPDEFSLVGREVYLHCPNGYGRTKLNNAFFERRLRVPATTRNWRTVSALCDLTSNC